MNLRRINRKIARENNISVIEVKKEMQIAISSAYNNLNMDKNNKVLKNDTFFREKIPTPDEFIKDIVKNNKFI